MNLARPSAVRVRARAVAVDVKAAAALRPEWRPVALDEAARIAFDVVRSARAARDPERCRAYVTDSLYRTCAVESAAMRALGRVDRLEDARVIHVAVIAADTFPGAEHFWAYIGGGMRDYEVDEKGAIQRGSRRKREFQEYWKFVREDDRWRADRVERDVTFKEWEKAHRGMLATHMQAED